MYEVKLRGLQYEREKKKVTNPYGVKGKDEAQNELQLSTAEKLAGYSVKIC
jgi:hypothetical protein